MDWKLQKDLTRYGIIPATSDEDAEPVLYGEIAVMDVDGKRYQANLTGEDDTDDNTVYLIEKGGKRTAQTTVVEEVEWPEDEEDEDCDDEDEGDDDDTDDDEEEEDEKP